MRVPNFWWRKYSGRRGNSPGGRFKYKRHIDKSASTLGFSIVFRHTCRVRIGYLFNFVCVSGQVAWGGEEHMYVYTTASMYQCNYPNMQRSSKPSLCGALYPLHCTCREHSEYVQWNVAIERQEWTMSSTTQNVSVIICAYTEKRWDDLVAAIQSVRRQTVQALEIIVVID